MTMKKQCFSHNRPRFLALPLMVLVAFLGLLTACGGSGSSLYTTGGRYCSEGENPLPFEIEGATKISLDSAKNELPKGDFVYDGADYFIIDPSLENGRTVRLHIQERYTLKSDGARQLTQSVVCARGLAPHLEFSHNKMAVTGMSIPTSGKITMDIHRFAFHFADGKLNIFKDLVTDLDFDGNPSKVFGDKDWVLENNSTLYKKTVGTNEEYEIRSHDKLPDKVEHFISLRFLFEPTLPAAEDVNSSSPAEEEPNSSTDTPPQDNDDLHTFRQSNENPNAAERQI